MKARPILFSSPMVRALLSGAKTQTRRIINAPTTRGSYLLSFNHGVPELNFGPDDQKSNGDLRWHRSRYGRPGDLLWVRESFAAWWTAATGKRSHVMGYRADIDDPDWDGFGCDDPWWIDAQWEPSIHMPRAYSRLTLRITDVRLQRLQDISEEDARAEGAEWHDGRGVGHSGWRHDGNDGYVWDTARTSFFHLWNRINGTNAVGRNPWVWAISFQPILRNLDDVIREAA